MHTYCLLGQASKTDSFTSRTTMQNPVKHNMTYMLSVRTFNLFTLTRTCQLHPPGWQVLQRCSELLHIWMNNHFGERKDLVFIDFQLFPRLEGRNGSRQWSTKTGFHRNIREYVATILYQARGVCNHWTGLLDSNFDALKTFYALYLPVELHITL